MGEINVDDVNGVGGRGRGKKYEQNIR